MWDLCRAFQPTNSQYCPFINLKCKSLQCLYKFWAFFRIQLKVFISHFFRFYEKSSETFDNKKQKKNSFSPQHESETAVHNCRQFSVKIVIKRNWCCKWVKALSRVFRIRNFHFNLSKWGAKCDTVFLFQGVRKRHNVKTHNEFGWHQ